MHKMDELEKYIESLESILQDSTDRMKKTLILDVEIFHNEELVINEKIDDLLFSLATNLEYYDSNQ